jgi:RecF/RecN/SMC family protein
VRIDAISLSWFRGAADPISLDLGCKSMVVYGTNASGKSSFVDAVEYVLNGGRITHLAHEYSGKKQEHAVPNRLKPRGATTGICIRFRDKSEIRVEVNGDGSSKSSGASSSVVGVWDYRRTVLRQDEVVAFIKGTKGDKYSSLLPLLGLHPMEVAAENLRQLAKNIESLSGLQSAKTILRQAEVKRKAAFGAMSESEIVRTIEELHSKYCEATLANKDGLSLCGDLIEALETRIAQLSADHRQYLALRAAADLDMKKDVDSVRAASVNLASAADPLIGEKLSVLEPAEVLIARITADSEIPCPACGQFVQVDRFRAHVEQELERLREIRETFNQRRVAMATLSDSVKSLRANLCKPDLKDWWNDFGTATSRESLGYLEGLDADVLRTACTEKDLEAIESRFLPLIDAAASASVEVPPDAKHLRDDQRTVEAAKIAFEATEQAASVTRVEALVSLISSLEAATRDEIRLRSKAVISEISDDVRDMWAILHPQEAIEDVRLYLPEDADKAIDIRLKFYGEELDSPRLTLSEGYRNSLGLCIFLAMAKREGKNDRPVFLDDVVVSLDRGHRGMIIELLEKYFGERQTVILTHDRDWYTELRQQLSAKTWAFKTLLPYETPKIGIRWSNTNTTFDDARAQLRERPDSAGNDARKIMDVELAVIAERVQISLPFMRFDKNDRRMAHDFIERLIADGRKCFEKRKGETFVTHEEAIETLREADRLLLSWANRASHSFDLVRPEAVKLIEACERAIESFKCACCGKSVGFANAAGREWMQCQCGEIRWRYGKV